MKKGFTLIELLVVVLIIGILAAIALPQYTKAVEKARMTEVVSNFKVMQDALDRYVMANGYPSTSKTVYEDLDIELGGGKIETSGSYAGNYVTKNFHYFLPTCGNNSCTFYANRNTVSGGTYGINMQIFSDGRIDKGCYTAGTKLGQTACKNIEKEYTYYDGDS
ncbi:prepilin-type N-terminal cleavage/methylation domain-containing protein [Elusimicrobium posterum]|uniref:type IV pilin protein n=1 Tax=Elusimicrobium posterum TaxID=3116653 RepID=UPI003C73FF5A